VTRGEVGWGPRDPGSGSAVHGGKLPARDAAAEALILQGFPNLVVLGDEGPRGALAAAKKRMQALDPVPADPPRGRDPPAARLRLRHERG
jgi:hypothetical protein